MRMPRSRNHALVFCVFALCLERAFGDNKEEIKRLKNDLLHPGKYKRTVRPQGDVNGTTVVSVELKAVSVPTLTPKRHHLYMNAFVCLSWTDKRLVWDADKYGGLDSIFVNSSKMWTPSILHLSPLDVRGPRDALASLTSAGEACWCPLYSIGAVCETDMSDFPFDRHTCNIVFTNAMSQEKDVNLTLGRQPELLEQQPSEFRVLSMKAARTIQSFDTGKYVYPRITFTVLLERRTSLHLFTVLVPTVAVVFLSLLVFWLPPESPRKLTLIGAAMLASLLLLYRAEDVVSGSSGVPRIVKALGAAVLLNSLIAATTVLSINMAMRPPSFTLPVVLVRCSEFLAFRLPCPCPGGQSGADDDGGVQNKSFSNAVAREWYTAARALDRVLGLVFSAAFVALCL